jgi:oligopeptide transport system ATP-binding protein
VLIEVENLVKEFHDRHGGAVRAVDSVSFAVDRGETVGLVGESGCGKSTIGRCLLRLYRPDGGSIAFDGERIEHLGEKSLRPMRHRMQMVFQDPAGSANPSFTVRRTIADALRRSPLSRHERTGRIVELLASVGLDERFLDRRPDELSGGQLQRVAIARALATDPDFVFLDEPTSALDLSVRGQIVNLLADLQAERGLGYLFASHDLGVVKFLADRLIVMYLGRVVEEGPTDQVLSEPRHPYTRALVLSAGLADDPDAEELLVRGELPASPEARAGCRYADRCPFVHERCAAEPPLLDAGPGRSGRCWLLDEDGSPDPVAAATPHTHRQTSSEGERE